MIPWNTSIFPPFFRASRPGHFRPFRLGLRLWPPRRRRRLRRRQEHPQLGQRRHAHAEQRHLAGGGWPGENGRPLVQFNGLV